MKYITSNDKKLAYKFTEGEGVGIIFIGGYKSIMKGRRRSRVISNFCKKNNIPFLEFDYSGYGASEGAENEWELKDWFQNLVDLIDNVAPQKNILIGHSMGGYLMLLAAMVRPKNVKGLIGMAAWFDNGIKTKLKKSSFKSVVQESYVGIEYAVDIKQPARFLHGLYDDVVSYQSSEYIADIIPHDNVEVLITKETEHSIEKKVDLDKVCEFIKELIKVKG